MRRHEEVPHRYVDIFDDSEFWATKWGVWVDRISIVVVKTKGRMDQWFKDLAASVWLRFGFEGQSVGPSSRGVVGLESVV